LERLRERHDVMQLQEGRDRRQVMAFDSGEDQTTVRALLRQELEDE
jgi:hypothetical protein